MLSEDLGLINDRFHNHTQFAPSCLSIKNEMGTFVPMELQPAQIKLHEGIQRQREAGKPVRIVYLKARRVMVSSATAAQFFHSTAFYRGQHCLVVAHDLETANNIFEFYENFDTYFKPLGGLIRLPRVKKKSFGYIEWENGSWVKVGTANNLNLGRSFSIRRLQLDEYAMYPDARELRTSLMAAVPKDPETMVIVPSTAKGVGNDFHKLWLQATDPMAGSDWLAIFCAWWEHPLNVYPLALPPERFQWSMDDEERELKGRYGLSLEQLMWRRWVIRNDLDGDPIRFRQEHPSNPEEAFLASGRPRFDIQSIQRMPVVREPTMGRLEVNPIGVERRIVFLQLERGELMLFRRPQPGRHYIIGADTAEGIDANGGRGDSDADWSTACVLDRDTGEQVAMFRARCTPSAFGEVLALLGEWFNWAGIVPEVNSIGIGTLDRLLGCKYPPYLIYHRQRQPDEDPMQRADNIGWKTTMVSRQQLLSKLDTALREGSIAVHDPITVQELLTFVIKPSGKAEAQSGCHDDTVFALALAVVGIEQMPRERPGTSKRNLGNRDKELTRGRILRILQ